MTLLGLTEHHQECRLLRRQALPVKYILRQCGLAALLCQFPELGDTERCHRLNGVLRDIGALVNETHKDRG